MRRFEKISFEKTAIQYEKKIHVQPSLNKNVATPLWWIETIKLTSLVYLKSSGFPFLSISCQNRQNISLFQSILFRYN